MGFNSAFKVLNCDNMVLHVLRENSNMTRLSRNNQQDATLY